MPAGGQVMANVTETLRLFMRTPRLLLARIGIGQKVVQNEER